MPCSNASGVGGAGGKHAAAVGWAAAAGSSNWSDSIMAQGAAVLETDAVADKYFELWIPVTPCTRETGAVDGCAS